jgi:hypothetical protein
MAIYPYFSTTIINKDVLTNSSFKAGMTLVLDSNRPDVGLGHSIAERTGIDCNKIEGFGQKTQDDNYIVIILLLIIILIIYKFWKK